MYVKNWLENVGFNQFIQDISNRNNMYVIEEIKNNKCWLFGKFEVGSGYVKRFLYEAP